MSELAPIALFVYARPAHTAATLAALAANPLASRSDLVVFADGARSATDAARVREVRDLVGQAAGFRSVEVVARPANLGLSRNIIDGVTRLVTARERVIVVEDDLVTARHFLDYMNDGLDQYATDDRVASIHGYCYPTTRALPETFFLRGADCWGWATWRRAWSRFEPDGRALRRELERRALLAEFDLDGAYPYSAMLDAQIAGTNDSWAIRWHASAFLANQLTLYPARTLVQNIGVDGTGIHSGTSTIFDARLHDARVHVGGIEVAPSAEGRAAFAEFHRRVARASSLRARAEGRAKTWIRSHLARLKRRVRPPALDFEGPLASWDAARARSEGYDAPEIHELVRRSALLSKHEQVAYDRDSHVFDEPRYEWPELSALLHAAAEDRGELRVLDVGGALGSFYFQHRKWLDALPLVRWGIVEQPHYVRTGAAELADDRLTFHASIAEATSAVRPNVVLAASSLQYLPAPLETLSALAAVPASTLVIARTPMSSAADDVLSVQRVAPEIYAARYPMWILSRARLLRALAPAFEPVAHFESIDDQSYRCGSISFRFDGIVLRRPKHR